MAGTDKTVKVTISVDAAAAAKAKRAIAEITTEVSKLVEMTNRVGGLFGGGGGGGLGVRVGNIPGAPGTGAATQITHKTAGAAQGGGLIGGLTGGVANTAAVFRGASENAKASVKSMQDGLRSLADAGDREVNRLQRSFGKLSGLYKAANADMGRMRGTPSLGDAAAAEVARMRGPGTPMPFSKSLNKLQDLAGKGDFASFLKLLPEIAMLGAGVRTTDRIMQTVNQGQLANLNYSVNSPLFVPGQRAQVGQIFGGNSQAIRHGDMARVYAMDQLSRERYTQQIVSDEHRRQQSDIKSRENPVTLREHMRSEGLFTGGKRWLGNVFDADVRQTLNHGVTAATFFRPGSPLGRLFGAKYAEDSQRRDVLQRKTVEENSLAQQAQQYQQALQSRLGEDPGFNDRINQFYSRSISDSGLMRALGMGGGNSRSGSVPVYQGTLMRALAEVQGRDVGEFASAAQRLSTTAGRGFIGHFQSLLGPETGGLGNAAHILAAGSQFGGAGDWGDARDLLGRAGKNSTGMQSFIGRGGLDVAAGNNIFGTGIGIAQSSGGFVGGSGVGGLLGTMATAGFGGSPGRDMAFANMMPGGMAAANATATGTIDPFGQALNYSAALRAAPGAAWSTVKALSEMSFARRAEIMATGKVDDYEAGQGLSPEMVKRMFGLANQSRFARALDSSGYLTKEQREAVGRYRASGGFDYLKGMKGQEHEMNLLAGVYATGTGMTKAQAVMETRLFASAAGVLQRPRGRGATDTLRGDTALAKANETRAIQTHVEGQKEAAESGAYSDTYGKAPYSSVDQEVARRRGLKTMQYGGDTKTALKGVTEALQSFIRAMDAEYGTGGLPSNSKGRPPAPAGE